MEDDHNNNGSGKGTLETGKADRSVWLMKCPLVVGKSWQSHAASQDSQPVAKVILSLDPLQSDDMQVRQTHPIYIYFVLLFFIYLLIDPLYRFVIIGSIA